jgi:hypothetical protein
MVADFLLPLLSEFIRRYPRVTYDIVVGGTQDVIEVYRQRRGDAASARR